MSPELHHIYRAQPAAKLLFDWILRAGVEDNRTTVEELIEQLEVPRKTAINLLRALDEAGHGEFKVGRKGHPSRLEWSDDPQALAERLNGGDRQPADEDPNEETEVDPKLDGRDPEPDAPGDQVDEHVDAELGSGSSASGKWLAGVDEIAGVATPRQRRASGPETELIEHSYVLRPQLRVVIALPEDLSAREAEVLAGWIRNLSFER
jgi:hypothetical protein